MSYQNISYALPQIDLDAVKAAITTITTKLPFLITLDAQERKELIFTAESPVSGTLSDAGVKIITESVMNV